MSSMIASISKYCTYIVLLAAASISHTQTVSDLGMMGGSGLTFTPILAVTPESHFRFDMTRLNFLNAGTGNINTFGITGGLSSNMEFSAKFQSVQAGTSLSPAFIGFGGKIVAPLDFPYGTHIAFWDEVVSTSNVVSLKLMPIRVNRAMIIIQPGILRYLNGDLLMGLTSIDNTKRLVFGFNGSRSLNGWLKIGGEFQNNYYGINDRQESMLILLRPQSNLCLQLSPGYLQSSAASSWMFSIGICASTAGIEFINPEKPKEKPMLVPSIDDLEKQLNEEKKKEKEN
ncbi:MAG: hypothetical protein ACHQQQ_13500 [Bacteroidota bacterium]